MYIVDKQAKDVVNSTKKYIPAVIFLKKKGMTDNI